MATNIQKSNFCVRERNETTAMGLNNCNVRGVVVHIMQNSLNYIFVLNFRGSMVKVNNGKPGNKGWKKWKRITKKYEICEKTRVGWKTRQFSFLKATLENPLVTTLKKTKRKKHNKRWRSNGVERRQNYRESPEWRNECVSESFEASWKERICFKESGEETAENKNDWVTTSSVVELGWVHA